MDIHIPNKLLVTVAVAALLVGGAYVEYKVQPVAITTDVAHYAAERIEKGHPQTTASVQPQQSTPHVAKTPSGWVSAPLVSTTAAPLPQMAGQHIVKKGETLWSIARTHKVPPKELLAANDMTRDTKLYPGQMISIPKQ